MSLSTLRSTPKTDLHLIFVGGEQPSRGMPGEAMSSRGRPLAEEPPRALSLRLTIALGLPDA